MSFKFEKLEVWRMALEYIDIIYALANLLPKSEEYNLKTQLTRAATSIALNIAEGSTGQTDAEQGRFIGLAIRSLIETVACMRIIQRRAFPVDEKVLQQAIQATEPFAIKLQAFRKAIAPNQQWLREEQQAYSLPEADSVTE